MSHRTPPAALVACTLAHSMQIKCSDALDTHGEMNDIVETVVSSSSRSGLRSSTSNTSHESLHGCVPSSESERSHTPVLQPGIRYRLTFVLKLVK